MNKQALKASVLTCPAGRQVIAFRSIVGLVFLTTMMSSSGAQTQASSGNPNQSTQVDIRGQTTGVGRHCAYWNSATRDAESLGRPITIDGSLNGNIVPMLIETDPVPVEAARAVTLKATGRDLSAMIDSDVSASPIDIAAAKRAGVTLQTGNAPEHPCDRISLCWR